MSTPMVSIIITNYFQKKYIEDAVFSVFNQTYENWEIIIVNDTGNEENLYNYAGYQRVTVVLTENIGSSRARNKGASLARGKYLLFLDADDKLHPQFLEKTVKLLEENPQISVAYTDTQHFDGANSFWEQPEYNFYSLLQNNFMCICSLIRRRDFETVGGYNPDNFNYWEDYELWIAMGAKGFYAKHIPEKLFYYRVHPDSSSQSQRANALAYLYKAFIISRFPELYPRGWGEQAQAIVDEFPKGFMSWTPPNQEKYLKEKGK